MRGCVEMLPGPRVIVDTAGLWVAHETAFSALGVDYVVISRLIGRTWVSEVHFGVPAEQTLLCRRQGEGYEVEMTCSCVCPPALRPVVRVGVRRFCNTCWHHTKVIHAGAQELWRSPDNTMRWVLPDGTLTNKYRFRHACTESRPGTVLVWVHQFVLWLKEQWATLVGRLRRMKSGVAEAPAEIRRYWDLWLQEPRVADGPAIEITDIDDEDFMRLMTGISYEHPIVQAANEETRRKCREASRPPPPPRARSHLWTNCLLEEQCGLATPLPIVEEAQVESKPKLGWREKCAAIAARWDAKLKADAEERSRKAAAMRRSWGRSKRLFRRLTSEEGVVSLAGPSITAEWVMEQNAMEARAELLKQLPDDETDTDEDQCQVHVDEDESDEEFCYGAKDWPSLPAAPARTLPDREVRSIWLEPTSEDRMATKQQLARQESEEYQPREAELQFLDPAVTRSAILAYMRDSRPEGARLAWFHQVLADKDSPVPLGAGGNPSRGGKGRGGPYRAPRDAQKAAPSARDAAPAAEAKPAEGAKPDKAKGQTRAARAREGREGEDLTLACSPCGMEFSTPRALSEHANSLHHRYHLAVLLARGKLGLDRDEAPPKELQSLMCWRHYQYLERVVGKKAYIRSHGELNVVDVQMMQAVVQSGTEKLVCTCCKKEINVIPAPKMNYPVERSTDTPLHHATKAAVSTTDGPACDYCSTWHSGNCPSFLFWNKGRTAARNSAPAEVRDAMLRMVESASCHTRVHGVVGPLNQIITALSSVHSTYALQNLDTLVIPGRVPVWGVSRIVRITASPQRLVRSNKSNTPEATSSRPVFMTTCDVRVERRMLVVGVPPRAGRLRQWKKKRDGFYYRTDTYLDVCPQYLVLMHDHCRSTDGNRQTERAKILNFEASPLFKALMRPYGWDMRASVLFYWLLFKHGIHITNDREPIFRKNTPEKMFGAVQLFSLPVVLWVTSAMGQIAGFLKAGKSVTSI